MKSLAVILLITVGFFVGLPVIGTAFRAVPYLFVALWLSTPVLAWLLRRPEWQEAFSENGLVAARTTLVAAALFGSLLMFSHWGWLRDTIAPYLDSGYWSHSDPEAGYSFGEAHFSTTLGEVLHWVVQWVLLAVYIAVPWLAYKLGTHAITRKREAGASDRPS